VTRRVILADRPRLVIETRSAQRTGWGGRWLLVTITGLGAWLFGAQSAAGESIGLAPAVLWLAALTLIGAVWRKIDLDRGVWLGIDIDRREAYGLIALLVASLAIWLLQIDRLPASIWGDEGAYWTMARDIAAGRATVSLFGMGTYSWPVAGSIYQSFWVSLFGPTLAAWRAGSVIATLASLVPLYFLARGLLGRRVAFVALAFFAASPFALAYGRTGYLYAQSIFPVAAGAALLVAAIRRDSRLFAFLAGAVGGSAFMLYHTARFSIVLGVLVLIAFARMMRGVSFLRLSLAYSSALVLAATPALVYSLTREPAAFADKLAENSLATVSFAETVFGRDELLARATFTATRDHDLFFEPSLYTTLALRGWALTAIGLNRAGLVNEHYVVGPLAGPIALLAVLGVGWCLARWRRPGYALWPIWLFAGTFLLSAIESFPPHASDLLPIVPALAVLTAIGLVGLIDALRGFWMAMPQRVEIGLLAAVPALLCAVGLQMYFFEMPQRYKPNLEMAMFWSAFDLPRGSTIAFVRDESYPPDFTPWGLQNFETGMTWLPIEPSALDRADVRAACTIDCRIFFTPPFADAVEARLRAVFDGGRVTAFTNEAGETIGYAYSPPGRP
jgi:4-amino-4-deoxy-L-arabinose transferase-like glycosyltransferase